MKMGRPLYFRVYSDGTFDLKSLTEEPPSDHLGWMEVTQFCPVGCPDNPEELTLLREIRNLLLDIRAGRTAGNPHNAYKP